MNLLTRDVTFQIAERDDDSGSADGRTLEGYATVFDQDTVIDSWEGNFTERIAKGAFRKTLRERKPVMQYNHGRDMAIGTVPIGVYDEIREDDQGLYVKGRVFQNAAVEPVREAIAEKAITGMSITMRVVRDEWRDKDGKLVKPAELRPMLWSDAFAERRPLQRTIKEVQLPECGPVLYPAYTGTSVGVRSATPEEITQLEAQYRATMASDPDGGAAPPPDDITEDNDNSEERSEQERSSHSEAESDPPGTPDTPVTDDAALEGTSPTAENRDAALEGTSQSADQTTRKESPVMNLAALKARKADIIKRMTALDTEFRDVELPTEQRTEYDGLKTELGTVDGSITSIEARHAEVAAYASAHPANTAPGAAPEQRESKPGAPAVHTTRAKFDLDEIRADAHSSADYLVRVDENARRAIDETRYYGSERGKAQEHATRLLEEVDNESRDLAKRILLTGSPEYASAFAKVIRHNGDAFCTQEERQAILRAQLLNTDNAGGYAVPFQLDPTVILTNSGSVNPIRELARVETIVGKKWQGVTSAGASVTRGAEASTAPDSSFTLAQPEVSTNRVQGFVPFSIEAEMTWSTLMREITNVLVDAKDIEEDSFITGDGTGTNPGGVIGSLSGNTVTAAGTASFAAADIYKVQNALGSRWERNASWLGNKTIYNLIRQFDTAGGAQFWGSLAFGNPNTILDFPARKASAMASVLTTGSKILLHGDFKQFLIVDRIGMNVELIPHVFDAANSNRPTGQRGVYAVWMNNSKILVPSAFKVLVTG